MDAQTLALAYRYLTRVLPLATEELRALERRATLITQPDIRREALASLKHKAFHVHGGAILANFLDVPQSRHYVRLVAAFETAVDYLDNLCDRIGSQDETDFRALHESLLDAVTPDAPLRDYFRVRGGGDDGYLSHLVLRSQRAFADLPAYGAVRELVADVTRGYCELQALKHLRRGERERRCAAAFEDIDPALRWWEGAAASGSTMPTFALAYAALDASCTAERARAVHAAYFPFFSATHILLDYLIDQAEDAAHGELNFVACYDSPDRARDGIASIAATAYDRLGALEDADRHRFALRAMCAFYGSRRKVRQQKLTDTVRPILDAVGVDDRPALAQPLLDLYARLVS